MKQLEKFLKDNNIQFEYIKMGNLLYMPEYNPLMMKFTIDLQDKETERKIYNYLKKRKKYFFDYSIHSLCDNPDIHYNVMLSDERKKLDDLEKQDAKICERFWNIYHQDQKKAEKFYQFMKRKLKTA